MFHSARPVAGIAWSFSLRDNKMLESVWQKVSEASGRRWVLASLIPTALFWASFGLVYYGLWIGWSQTLAWWNGLTDASRTLSLLVVIVPIGLTAFGLDMIGPFLLRTAKGSWDFPPFVGPWLQKRRAEQWKKHFEMIEQQLLQVVDQINEGNLWPEKHRDLESKRIRLQSELREFPEKIMPTRLGNILRAAEEDPYLRYGLDPATVWPRLYPLLSEVLRGEVDDARANLDSAVRISTLALVFSLIWGTQAVISESWLLAGIAALGLGGTLLAHHATFGAATLYAELIRSAFDLHRFDLYRNLHLPLPSTTDTERQSGEQITTFLWQGGKIAYKHPENKDNQ